MAALPYMQLYIADYLADTMHLSTEEHGAYLLLMFNYWQTGRAIPKTRLAKIARVSDSRWVELQAVLNEFFEDDGENWIHLRIERDIESVVTSPRGKKLPGGDSLKGFNGYVYFIKNPASGLIKIGYSKNPWARLSELRRNYGSELSVVATIKTVEKSETSIHAAFDRYRVEGEWFIESESIKAVISAVVAGELTTVDATRSYVDNYCSSTTATTNTDTDLKENPSLNAGAMKNPSGEELPSLAMPRYLDGVSEPIGKFSMTDSWLPSRDFRQRAASWGISLPEPDYLLTELAEFTAYWESEGKVFTQIQWEQKFARHVARVRTQVKPETGGNSHVGARSEPTASRAVQQIQSAHAEWRRRNGLDGDGNSLATVAGHGGGVFEPMDPEERGGAFAYLDSPDRFDD
ncbi:DUF1376 domain-containing protein [Citrobacter portucalensis]|uniref:DUF1376 domain-containing protein n=1 Tax=Citrobacter portucalensis TaxID=1639133 RepID=UPI002B2225AD|nr:DUF1376 domain-containing protein [Citrobacter portucalensis]MEB0325779.1 DUF1376 domain-containing protein [Citrobacter portucalensis]MEB0357801.1 DUF1376 domain-containing protein [Citrobacter portucalensis]MEB0403256.1 DUF1376 domain-containing protein [Citrobacter portucalensis]UDR04184.1 DUF1376 domain-containing protein [Citrobacter freundii]